MKQFYSLSALKCTRSFLLCTLLLCAFFTSKGQVYYAILSGASEAPPNSSPGTGKALVTIIGTTMRVQATFSGLIGNTTASHIHAPTPAAGTGTAGVATTIPTFPGFPSGVKAGTYDNTFDMTQPSSYNPAFLNNNGGNPTTAFAALKAAINAGKAYLNIHSDAFPPGEIRGFLTPCPTIAVSIPDAFALAQGVLPNTVYPGYTPASSLTLNANVSGGTGPYSYTWSNGSTNNAITVSPAVTTSYSVTVRDQNGCPGMASKTVKVMDITGGKKGDKVDICHKGRNTLTIATSAVSDHLGHGDMLGTCNNQGQAGRAQEMVTAVHAEGGFSVKVLSNPSPNYFDLQLSGKADDNVQLTVFDLLGRVVESRPSVKSNQTLRLGTSYSPGIYLVQIAQGAQIQRMKLIKAR